MNLRNLAIWGVIVLVLIGLYSMMTGGQQGAAASQVTYSELLDRIEGGQIKSAEFNGLTVRRVEASLNHSVGASCSGRGLWVINGVKQNITVEDSTFNNNRLVGIDISDGNVTGLSITGNEVMGNGDSGIAALGMQGPTANLIDGNTVTNNGRFGIEVKNSAGNGASSGPSTLISGGSGPRARPAAARCRPTGRR